MSRAVLMAEDAASAAEHGVLTLGELIHNERELARLSGLGVKAIDSPDEAPQGATVVIRSHGARRDTIERLMARGVNVVDATCPYVKSMHGIAANAPVMDDGRIAQVIIVGDARHPEVIGTAGWCNGDVIIVANADEALRVPHLSEAVVIAQTTIAPDVYKAAVEALRGRVANMRVFDTICTVTAKRQEEAAELARLADMVLVVGGRNSSNTRQLARTCEAHCARVCQIEGAADLAELQEELGRCAKVSVISGASTPDWVLLEVAEALQK